MGRAANHNLAASDGERRTPRRRPSRSKAPWRWTDEELERELREFLAGRDSMPTRPEFEQQGRNDLRAAMSDFGGIAYWAHRLGVSLRPGQEREAYLVEDALRDARAVYEQEGLLPNTKRLRALGFNRLASFIEREGGVARFAAKHGIDR
jgi:hypothetical protein